MEIEENLEKQNELTNLQAKVNGFIKTLTESIKSDKQLYFKTEHRGKIFKLSVEQTFDLNFNPDSFGKNDLKCSFSAKYINNLLVVAEEINESLYQEFTDKEEVVEGNIFDLMLDELDLIISFLKTTVNTLNQINNK